MESRHNKILVVDDEPFATSLIRRQLEKFGYTDVEVAADGAAALEAARRASFDVVLLDMQMPKMSGAEVLRAFKSDLELHDLPIIVVSGEGDIDLVIECIESGAEDYIDKPVNAGLLRARLRNVFERQRLRRLEALALEQARAERQRSDALLEAILPPGAVRELMTTGTVRARRYENVVILFCDIADFTSFSAAHPPEEVVGQLESLFARYEEIVNSYGLEKIKTVGDAFMAASSLNVPQPDPLRAAVVCGLEMMQATQAICPGWRARVGVAEGPVVAGIVGKEKFQFDVWGDTVNVAARMTEVGRCGAVTMPQECWQRAGGADYVGKLLGAIDVKGKGPMHVVECTELRRSIAV